MIHYIIEAILLIAIAVESFLLFKKNTKKTATLVEELTKIKNENDFVLDKESDDISIQKYLKVIKDTLDNYDNSRSKMIAFRTRRLLMYETIMIIPVISKYIKISIEYDTTSKILSKKSDRDIMRLLKEAYNSYSEDSQETFNDILLCALLLSDNK